MIFCYHCEHAFERKTKIGSTGFEEQNNIYGTYCPKCNHYIKPDGEPGFVKRNREKKEEMKNSMLKKIKKKLFGE